MKFPSVKRSSQNPQSHDMLTGSLWDKILLFALPIAASASLQQLFNSADTAVVGRFAGSNALAAVGANGAVINLLINLFAGLSVGTNVVLSTALGKGDQESASKTVHTSILFSLFSGFILMVVGLLFARPIMEWMSTPAEIMEMAISYFRIYFTGMPFLMLYNFEAAILRSKGDTKRPLVVLTLAGILNLLLNLLFVITFKMSVAGVALATVLSNALSSLVLLYLLMKEDYPIRLHFTKLHFHPAESQGIISIGLPAGMQGMLFAIANVIVQTAVNSLGSIAIAGSQAGLNGEYFAFFLLSGFAQAAITFIGQNRGAGNYARCRRIFYLSWLMGLLSLTIYVSLVLLFDREFISIFTNDPDVIELGLQRMHVILVFEVFNMSIEVFSGAIRGYGRSLIPTLICIVCICVYRVIWVYTAFRSTQSFMVLMACYPISWILCTSGLIVAYLLVRRSVEADAGYIHFRKV